MAMRNYEMDYSEAVDFLRGMFPMFNTPIIERALDEHDCILEKTYDSLLKKSDPKKPEPSGKETGMNILLKEKKDEKAGPAPVLTKAEQEAEQKAWEEAWKIQEQYYKQAEIEEQEYQESRINDPVVDEFKFTKKLKPKKKKVIISGIFEKQSDPVLEEIQFSKSWDTYVHDMKESLKGWFKKKKK